MRRVILPLHDICSALGNDLTKCLPAVHALTGCDTTSKIATKSAALNTVQKSENSSLVLDFNSPQLIENSDTDGRDIFGQMSQTSYKSADI